MTNTPDPQHAPAETAPTTPLDPSTQAAPATPVTPTTPAAPSYAAPAPAAPRSAQPTTMGHTNTFAVIAVILAFVQPIAGIIFGHISLSQIKRNGDAGRGLALTGLILGYVSLVSIIFFVVMYLSMVALFVGSMGTGFPGMDGMPDYPGY